MGANGQDFQYKEMPSAGWIASYNPQLLVPVLANSANGAMESFHALLQKNVLNTKKWETREELRIAIVTWIERTYHRRRRKRSLGNLTPIEFEALSMTLDAVLSVA